jgi:hypothetical protein
MKIVQGSRLGMLMTDVRVLGKHGGKSGDWSAVLE